MMLKLPVPFVKQPIGAGQIVKAATQAVGIKPCTPCQQRAAKLDKLLQITPLRRSA